MLNNISGFPELLPSSQIAFNKVISIIQNKFELYGFSPLDTPAVEKTSTLLAKGNDHEIYGVYRLAEQSLNSKKDLGLRFDLTVPLARFVAQNYGQLIFPYKRYHIGPVWRGERPQSGRYRQFIQCDIDIIGDNDLSNYYDGEILAIISNIFKAIGDFKFTIKINDRRILVELLKSFALNEAIIPDAIKVIDKFAKISLEQFKSELIDLGLKDGDVAILQTLNNNSFTNENWLEYLQTLSDASEFHLAVSDLAATLKTAQSFGATMENIQISPNLARGLNYYTGIVYETILNDFPELGSVCGGGRYANLTQEFSKKKLPGIGISIGASRLIGKLLEEGLIDASKWTNAKILVTMQNPALISHYSNIAGMLRNNNIATEIFLDDKSLGFQMKYAAKKGFAYAIIADEPEVLNNEVIIRILEKSEQVTVKLDELVNFISSIF